MNIRCPHCQTLFRVDPARVPAHGIRARCAKCSGTFQIPGSAAAGAAPAARAPTEAEGGSGRGAEAGSGSGLGSGSIIPGPGAGAAPPSPDAEPTYPPAPPPEPAPPAAPLEAREKPAPMPPPPEVVAPEAPAEAAPAPAEAPAAFEPAGQDAPAGLEAAPAPASASAADAAPRAKPVFGSRDPNARALRIARALVSDIVAYHPDRREKALASGTLRAEFREEIMKSWEEYVAQVGQELAKSTPYFRQSLNEILAQGQNVF